jgi:RNA polymerase sigma factor (sigma-70 family)
MSDDASLLRQYVEFRNEAAFSSLVGRHIDGIYSAALRRVGGDAHLAKDVAQEVFAALARSAPRVSSHPVPSAWLYTTTRNIAAATVRRIRRRKTREEEFSLMTENTSQDQSSAEWLRIGPILDPLIDSLKEGDRQAILLRFIERQNFAGIGKALNLSENAARMRVDRALDKLRVKLGMRGIESTASALATLLAEQVVLSAPAGLAAEATAAALATALGSGATGSSTLLFLTTMNAYKATIGIAAILAAASGVGIAEWRTNARLRVVENENQRLERLLASATGREIVLKARGMRHPAASMAGLGEHLREEMLSNGKTDKAAPSLENAGYRNAGQGDPHSAIETFAWASDRGDTATLAKTIFFGGNGRQRAQAVLAALPPEVQSQFSSPEELYALFIADDALSNPPPPESILESLSEQSSGVDRATLTLPGSSFHQEFQNTADGWKYVFPENAVEVFAHTILDPPQSPLAAGKGR